MTTTPPAPGPAGAAQQTLDAEHDPRLDDFSQASLGQMAARLPRTLATAARLGWDADRPAVLWLMACQVALGSASAAALAVTPTVMGHVLAAGDIAARLHAAVPSLTGLGAALVVGAGGAAGAQYAVARLAPEVTTAADQQILAVTPAVELAAYDRPGFAERLHAAGKGAEATETLIADAQAATAALAQLAAAASVLAVLHPLLLPLLVLAVLPRGGAAVVAARIAHRAEHRCFADNRLRYLLRYYSTEERSAAEVRVGTMSGFLSGWYRQVTGRISAHHRAAAPHVLRVTLAGSAISGLMLALCWGVLGWLAATGRMEAAIAATAVVAVQASTSALTAMVMAAARLFRTSLYLDDWQSYLRTAHSLRAVRGQTPIPPGSPGLIEVRDVSYRYPGRDHPALDGVSLTLRRGELVALVGENGCGKSTLVKLLTGLYLADEGQVRWDGVDLAQADLHSVCQRVGLVPQRFTRWPMDLRANIHLGQPRTEDDSLLLAAAKAAGADSVIAAAPYGLDTLVASSNWGGVDLSGGQWQRVAVARAFYRDADLLLLDEPTSAMDPRAEHQVIRRFKELAAGRAAVFVTHNLDNARIADRIIVLDHGRIVETGTFDSLLDSGRLFAELYKLAQDR
ncbi:ATP-binding cassette domain-containing protein [Streptomyces sp. NPDC050610]|uniref:ATP-binding cassette domain-containing protein n=1 Tax=Streptomyces sp. NPDC050610 TaxID=3157097 RepID=UPI00341D6723